MIPIVEARRLTAIALPATPRPARRPMHRLRISCRASHTFSGCPAGLPSRAVVRETTDRWKRCGTRFFLAPCGPDLHGLA
jgi:hypothetical protein